MATLWPERCYHELVAVFSLMCYDCDILENTVYF